MSQDPARDGVNWYAYVGNSPTAYVDFWGLLRKTTENIASMLKPTALEAAHIADHVYGRGELIGGWQHEYDHHDGTLQMSVYSKVVDGETGYVVANRGTDEFASDMAQNVLQSIGQSVDMWKSIEFAENFVRQYSNAQVTFVGHSKGGTEATSNALATNKDAIVFNAAPINSKAYDLSVSEYEAEMVAFYVTGDPIKAGIDYVNRKVPGLIRPIGEVVHLPQQSWWNPVTNHSAQGAIWGLQEAGYD